jgi:hypothetical protein
MSDALSPASQTALEVPPCNLPKAFQGYAFALVGYLHAHAVRSTLVAYMYPVQLLES